MIEPGTDQASLDVLYEEEMTKEELVARHCPMRQNERDWEWYVLKVQRKSLYAGQTSVHCSIEMARRCSSLLSPYATAGCIEIIKTIDETFRRKACLQGRCHVSFHREGFTGEI